MCSTRRELLGVPGVPSIALDAAPHDAGYARASFDWVFMLPHDH